MTRTVEKPWGSEEIFAETNSYVGKVLHIKAGHKLSRQYHNVKDETFLVHSGEMDLEIGQEGSSFVQFLDNILKDSPFEQLFKIKKGLNTLHMKPGDTYHCKPGTVHRMIALTDTDVIEVSTPELDDVVRLEDAYGREGTSKP